MRAARLLKEYAGNIAIPQRASRSGQAVIGRCTLGQTTPSRRCTTYWRDCSHRLRRPNRVTTGTTDAPARTVPLNPRTCRLMRSRSTTISLDRNDRDCSERSQSGMRGLRRRLAPGLSRDEARPVRSRRRFTPSGTLRRSDKRLFIEAE
jgi:hypothetical protein